MKIMIHFLLMTILSISHSSCQKVTDSPAPKQHEKPYTEEQFGNYWYTGKAEVVSYRLKQSRYGEMREGSAVLIFVTEPFSKSKQVKLDNPEKAGNDEVTVLKLNFTKKFVTGIYPYSMMLSSFTPVDIYHHPKTLKVSMSSQEWCGHVFSQANLKNDKYAVKTFSYFEKEGDQNFTIEAALLEDEIWNLIRLNYKALPVGEIDVIPGLFFTRMQHENLKPVKANASLQETDDEIVYKIEYPDRVLSITFSSTFPYEILSWQETFQGLGGQTLSTSATIDQKLHIDYWSRNKNSDSYLRDSLNLN